MKPVSSPEDPIIVLEIFNGFESYLIKLAEWTLYKGKGNGMVCLWIVLEAGKAIQQQEDTKHLFAEPTWELNLLKQDLSEELIKPGFIATIPESYD